MKEEKLYEAFSMLDINHTGKITKEELMNVLKLQKSDDKYVTELIKNADQSGEGAINYKDFLKLMGYKK